MFDKRQIKTGMTVVDVNGRDVGTVSQVHNEVVELTREGFADGLHHFVPAVAVRSLVDGQLVVEPGQATTVEAVAGAIAFAHAHPTMAGRSSALFGTSGHGTGFGGSGIGD